MLTIQLSHMAETGDKSLMVDCQQCSNHDCPCKVWPDQQQTNCEWHGGDWRQEHTLYAIITINLWFPLYISFTKHYTIIILC